jgi:hypothetical protein
MKKIENTILEEISRYKSINNYITEQDAELPPPPADAELPPPPADAGLPPDPLAAPVPAPEAPAAPTTGGTEPQMVDVANDPDVEKVGEEKGKTEEIEITDLVKSQKEIERKQEDYFENLFQHLNTLESKLGEMDNIMNKLNDLESKVEKYRVRTPQEKLELRTLDSGPYNQKLSDFFEDKEEEMEKTGKNEYVLTQDEVEDYSPNEIKKTFRNFDDLDKTIENFKQVR